MGAYTRPTTTFFDSHIQMAIKPQRLNANRRLMALYEGEDLPSLLCGALDANMARVQAHLAKRRGGSMSSRLCMPKNWQIGVTFAEPIEWSRTRRPTSPSPQQRWHHPGESLAVILTAVPTRRSVTGRGWRRAWGGGDATARRRAAGLLRRGDALRGRRNEVGVIFLPRRRREGR